MRGRLRDSRMLCWGGRRWREEEDGGAEMMSMLLVSMCVWKALISHMKWPLVIFGVVILMLMDLKRTKHFGQFVQRLSKCCFTTNYQTYNSKTTLFLQNPRDNTDVISSRSDLNRSFSPVYIKQELLYPSQ